MNYTEQQKKKQEILKRIQAQQQLEQQRAKQKEFGLDDVINTGKTINEQSNNLNSLSKGASRLGKTLSKSNHKVISGIGNRLQTAGDFGQKITGEPLKQRISGAIKNKLGIGTPKAPVTPTAPVPGTTPTGLEIGGSAGVGGGSLAGSAMTGGSTVGSSAIGSAIGSQVAGTAGATGGSALTSALGAELAGTAAGAGAAGAGSAIGSAISAAAPSAMAGTAAGAGAAGAGAAGAGAGAAALGALGPVGAALAAGYMIYSMIKSAKKKQQAKQMQISSQAAEEGAQQAAVKKANAMQNLQAQTPQAPQVQPTVEAPEMPLPQPEQVVQEQPQEDSSVMDIMQLIPGSTEGAEIPDAEAMPASLPEAPEVEAPQLEAPQIEPTALEGTPTGFAANVTPEATKASLMNRIKARTNVGSAVQSGLNKLSSGLSDFNAGYQDNARTSLTEGDLYKRIMSDTSEQTGETQTEDGAYVLSANEKKKKNLINRIGEAVGTAHRIAANPLTQGAIAGLAYAKSEDDPLYGLGKGVEWAQGKAKSDYYQKKVKPNSLPSIFGGYSEKDYNADTLSKYRETTAENNTMRAELEREKQAAKERNDQAEMQHKKDSLEETKRFHDAQIKRWSQGKGNVDMEMIEEMIRRGYRLEDGVWVK